MDKEGVKGPRSTQKKEGVSSLFSAVLIQRAKLGHEVVHISSCCTAGCHSFAINGWFTLAWS